jgi:hypothetical protein
VDKNTKPFEKVKTANAERLKNIKSLSIMSEAPAKELMAKVKVMHPKRGPGFVHVGALIIQTRHTRAKVFIYRASHLPQPK